MSQVIEIEAEVEAYLSCACVGEQAGAREDGREDGGGSAEGGKCNGNRAVRVVLHSCGRRSGGINEERREG